MDFKGCMVKHGSGHLRYVLFNIAMTVMVHNPVFYEFYQNVHKENVIVLLYYMLLRN